MLASFAFVGLIAVMYRLDLVAWCWRRTASMRKRRLSKGNKAEVKLIDFGLAKVMDDVVAKSFLGTRGYLAPEMLQRHAYDKAVDIWVQQSMYHDCRSSLCTHV